MPAGVQGRGRARHPRRGLEPPFIYRHARCGAEWSPSSEPSPSSARRRRGRRRPSPSAERIAENIRRAVKVRDEVLEHVIVALLAEGHILVEDYPGVGKTALARALSRSIDCAVRARPVHRRPAARRHRRHQRLQPARGALRVPARPDLRQRRARRRGQPRLAEDAVRPARVHAGAPRHRRRHSHELARPFLVFATQNPVEYEGTYPLPEAQVDRFMVRLSLGYPNADDEAGHARRPRGAATACSTSRPVADRAEVVERRSTPPTACTPRSALRDYIVALLRHTRARRPRRARRLAARRPDAAARRQGARARRRAATTRCPTTSRRSPTPVLAHRIMLVPEAAGVERARDRRRRDRGDAGALGSRAMRSALGCAALGLLLLLVAGTFDAEPLYVTGSALLLLGAGRGRRGSAPAPGARARARARRAQRASRSSRCSVAHRRDRRPAAAAAGLDRRAAAARAGALPRRPAPRARARRGHVRPPRPARAARRPRSCCATRSGSPSASSPAPTTDELLVLPRIFPVRATAGGGDATPAHARAALIAAAETEIDGLRPHREGSPASRIHWPALARGAGLMERKLISEADSRPLVVLDPRAPPSPEALDAAVRAAALAAPCTSPQRSGCALLLPGDRRAHVDRARPARPGRPAHVRLALVDEHDRPVAGRRAEPPRADRLRRRAHRRPRRRAGSAARPAAACSSSRARCPTAAPCSRSRAATATSARAPAAPPRWRPSGRRE